MSQIVKLRRSAVEGKIPSTGSLELGELAVNTTDGKAYLKKDDGTESIQSLVTTDSITTGSIFISGSMTITGSFTVNDYTLPSIDGEANQIIITDGQGNLEFDYLRTVFEQVKNGASVTLEKGTPVHVSSSVGNENIVIAASASVAETMPATLVLNEQLTPGQSGLAIAVGFINEVDTTPFDEGDVIYVGSSSGYTNIKPTGSNLIQNLGIVTKVAVNGSGLILGAGRANDVPNLLDGEIFIGEGSTAVKKPISDVISGSNFVYSGSFTGSFEGVHTQDGVEILDTALAFSIALG